MKRYLIFLITFAYALTGAWAAAPSVSLSGGTLTINSTEPGSLSEYNFTDAQKAATTLVLVGQFSESDLAQLNSINSLVTIDMSGADMKSTKYKVFSSEDARNGSDMSAVGTLYKSGSRVHKEWVNVNDEQNVANQNFENVSFNEDERNSNLNYEAGKYIRFIKSVTYYQLNEDRDWGDPIDNLDDNSKNNATMFDNVTAMQANTTLANGAYAKVVAGYKYYLVEQDGWNRKATLVDEEEVDKSKKIVDQTGEPNAWNGVNIGEYIRIASYDYYQLTTTRSWEPVQALPEGSTAKIPNFAESALNDNLGNPYSGNEPINVGDYIQYTSYNYYKMTATDQIVWEAQTLNSEGAEYDLGSRIYSTAEDMNSNTPAQTDLYALVGTGYNEGYDWSAVKFGNWSKTLEKAVLPTNADPSVFANDILNNCKRLNKVVFANGKAFIGEKPASGKTPITIKADNDTDYDAIKAAMIRFGYTEDRYEYTDQANETNYDNPTTLVIGLTDTDNIVDGAAETKSLTTIISEEGADGYETINFADGSTYDKATGVLQCSSLADYEKLEAWLEASGAEVSEVKFGKYVSIKDGVTIIDNTTEDQIYPLIGNNFETCTNLNDAEKNVLRTAVSLKIKGKFNGEDIRSLDGACKNVSRLDLSEAQLDRNQKSPFKSSLVELVLPAHFYDFNNGMTEVNVIPNEMCIDFAKLEKLVIPNTITEVGNAAFKGCAKLNDIDWGTGLQIIGEHAFQRTNLGPTLTIPASVTLIKKSAFEEYGKNLQYLYIPSDSRLQEIEDRAFFDDNGGLKEVHVECNKFITCAVEAFDDYHTNGHSDVATAKCRLFYPTVGVDGYVGDGENDSFEDYVGNFKAECFNEVLNQADLDNLKTVVNTGKVINGKQYGPYHGHGWYMFTSSGIIISEKTSWRTYSEDVPFYVPTENAAKFYLAWGVDAGQSGPAAESSGLVVKLVQMNPGDVVPANTGVLVNYNTATQGQSGVLMLNYAKGNNTPRYDAELEPDSKYTKNSTQYTNYLRKINNETLTIRNVELDASKNPTYRNFFFGNVDQLDEAERYWGKDFEEVIHNYKENFEGWMFLRAQTDEYTINNKAYLHLPASLTESTSDYSDRVDEGKTYEARLMGIIITDGDEATSVKEGVTTPSHVTDGYYTLQGQKVSVPNTRGLYIKNGKKVIVK